MDDNLYFPIFLEKIDYLHQSDLAHVISYQFKE